MPAASPKPSAPEPPPPKSPPPKSAPKPPGPRKPRVAFTAEVAARVLNALAAGQGLRRLTRRPGMPTRATIMRWLKDHPDFAERAARARRSGGLPEASGQGRPTGYAPHLTDEIYDRLSRGEPLRTVCRDPHLPSRSTVHTWAHTHARFAHELDLARENAAWLEADRRLALFGFRNYLDFIRSPLGDPRGVARRLPRSARE